MENDPLNRIPKKADIIGMFAISSLFTGLGGLFGGVTLSTIKHTPDRVEQIVGWGIGAGICTVTACGAAALVSAFIEDRRQAKLDVDPDL